jgi:hypothetical protein
VKSIHSAQLGSAADMHRVPGGGLQTIDWRSKFEKSPIVFLAAALGGGLLIGSAIHHRKSHSASQPTRDFEAAPAHRRLGWDLNDSLGVVKSILIGIAITQAKKLLFNPTPGRPTMPPLAPKQRASDSTTH